MIIRVFIIVALILSTNTIVFAFNNKDNLASLCEVDSSDGINQAEAYIVDEAYFLYQISGCGYAAEPVSEDKNWMSKTQIGIVGKPGPPIYVNKETGDITWGNPKKAVSLIELMKFTVKSKFGCL